MAATPFWGEAPVGMCYQYLSKYSLIFMVGWAEGDILWMPLGHSLGTIALC